MSREIYDVAIIGAGPAGAAAAIALAQRNRQVVLVDRSRFPRDAVATAWLSARAAPLLTQLNVDAAPLLGNAISDVTFHNADFSKSASPRCDEPIGNLVNRVTLGNALVATAREKRVTVADGVAVADIRLKESSALIELVDGSHVESRLLILASGSGTEWLDRVGLTRQRAMNAVWSTQIDAPLPDGDSNSPARVAIVFGIDNVGSFGFCGLAADRVAVTSHWNQAPHQAKESLVHLCRLAFENGVVPMDLSTEAAKQEPRLSPASVALDLETHVGKHTLAIGDAGGFVAAASNEGLYPAMWSARIAAEVIDEALRSPHSQDALMGFDSAWRIQMADYLRAPHTDNQFLLPLVFSNQPMTDRMAAAFFFGENI